MIWPASASFAGGAGSGKVVAVNWSATDKATIVWDLDDRSVRNAITVALEYSPDLNVGANKGFYFIPKVQHAGWGDELSEVMIRFDSGLRDLVFPRPPVGPHRYVFVFDRTSTQTPLKVWVDGVRQTISQGHANYTGWADGSKFTGATGLYYMARNISSNTVTGRASVPKVFPYAFTDAQAGEASKPPEYLGPVVTDTTTQGNWRGRYGKDGVRLFAWAGAIDLDGRPSLPGTWSDTAARHTWATDGVDVRSPQHPGQNIQNLVVNGSAAANLTGIDELSAIGANMEITRIENTGLPGFPTAARITITANASPSWGHYVSYDTRGMRSGQRGVIRLRARGVSGSYSGISSQIYNGGGTEMVQGSTFHTLGPEWREFEVPFTAARDLIAGTHRFRYPIGNSALAQVLDVTGVEVITDAAARNAGTAYTGGSSYTMTYTPAADFEGWLRLYFYDYDRLNRRSNVQVALGDVSSPVQATGAYTEGTWLSWPVRLLAGVPVVITVTNTGPGNSCVSVFALDREPVL